MHTGSLRSRRSPDRGGVGHPTVGVISVLSGAVNSAGDVLTQQHITFLGAKSTDPDRGLIIVDESSLHEASEALTRSSIAFKVEPPEQL